MVWLVVYATNHPPDTLSLEQAVLAYREKCLVERRFGRLKGKPLSLTPMYLYSDTRASGLIHLLSIWLRILTLIEHQVCAELAERQEQLAGLYAGNPKRTTHRPTAEALLTAFKGIYLSTITIRGQPRRHVTPLSELHDFTSKACPYWTSRSRSIASWLANLPDPLAK